MTSLQFYPKFLTATECEELICLMQGLLRPSTITQPDPDPEFRTSSTAHLSNELLGKSSNINFRISNVLALDPTWGEPLQGQRYSISQQFKPHTDYFEGQDIKKHFTALLGQRSWTFMAYLNEPKEGGSTWFPRLGCSITPQIGMGLAWPNQLSNGQCNPDTLHSGQPIIQGEKYIITKWFREPLYLK